ncbi:hypothetical protein BDW59DRAFT_137408, partial [Aspergillus cavernicola]
MSILPTQTQKVRSLSSRSPGAAKASSHSRLPRPCPPKGNAQVLSPCNFSPSRHVGKQNRKACIQCCPQTVRGVRESVSA